MRHPLMPHEVAVARDAAAGLMGARIVVAGGTPKRAELSLSPWTLAEVGREQGWIPMDVTEIDCLRDCLVGHFHQSEG